MLHAPRRPLIAAVALLTVLFMVSVPLAAGRRPQAAAQQPSQAAARLDAAAEDLAAGRATEARAAYLAVLVSTAAASPTIRDEAWTGLIRAATAAGDTPAAATLAGALLRHGPRDGDGVRYLYATALGAGDGADGAALAFRRVAAAGGPLATVARLRAAEWLAADGRNVESAAAFHAVAIDASLPPGLRAVAALGGADVLTNLGRLRQALDLLDAAATNPRAGAGDVATMRWRAATLRRDAGDQRWTADAAATIAVAPGAAEATLALDALVDAGEPVDPLGAAYVRYRARDNGDARQRYEAVIAAEPAAGTAHVAWFYLGALAERAPDERRAIAAYTASLQAAPQGGLADDARWWLGLLLEAAGRPADAAEQFERIVGDFPASPFARRARLRAPLARAAAGDSASALAQLRALTEEASADTSARAARWLAVLRAEDGGPALDPAAFDPTSIATILHLAGEAATTPLPDAARGEWATPDTRLGRGSKLDGSHLRGRRRRPARPPSTGGSRPLPPLPPLTSATPPAPSPWTSSRPPPRARTPCSCWLGPPPTLACTMSRSGHPSACSAHSRRSSGFRRRSPSSSWRIRLRSPLASFVRLKARTCRRYCWPRSCGRNRPSSRSRGLPLARGA